MGEQTEQQEQEQQEQGQDEEQQQEQGFDEGRARAEISKKNREAANLRARLKEAEQKAARLDEIEEAGKTEAQKLTDRLKEAEQKLAEAERGRLVAEVAQAKGLTAAQAKRLIGTSREELEADADELIETFTADDRTDRPVGGKPVERLTGGGDPTTEPEELDPRKLAARVTRRY